MFANPKVMTALVVDGSRFVGVVGRDAPDDQIGDDHPLRALASRDVPTIEPDALLSDGLALLDADEERGVVVLDPRRRATGRARVSQPGPSGICQFAIPDVYLLAYQNCGKNCCWVVSVQPLTDVDAIFCELTATM